MRVLATIPLLLTSLILLGQPGPPQWAAESIKQIQKDYDVARYIKPNFVLVDLSGDQKDDLALLIQSKTASKKGIAIIFAESNQRFIVGAGTPLATGAMILVGLTNGKYSRKEQPMKQPLRRMVT